MLRARFCAGVRIRVAVEQFTVVCVLSIDADNCATLKETRMRYWAYLVAKLVAAVGILWGVRRLMAAAMPPPETFMHMRFRDPFVTDLNYTFLMLVFWLFGAGLHAGGSQTANMEAAPARIGVMVLLPGMVSGAVVRYLRLSPVSATPFASTAVAIRGC